LQSNQKALIWNLDNPKKPVEDILHGHTRVVSDVNWRLAFSRTFLHFPLSKHLAPFFAAISSLTSWLPPLWIHMYTFGIFETGGSRHTPSVPGQVTLFSFLSPFSLSFLQFATSCSGCLPGEMEQIEPEHYCFFSRQRPSDLGQKGLAPLHSFPVISFFSTH